MENFFQGIVDYLLQFREWAIGFFGPSLPWLIAVSVIVSGLLLWGIFYSIAGSGYVNHKIEEYMDILRVGDVGKRRQLRAWGKIVKAAKSKASVLWKKSILEADQIFDEILKMSGYRGPTVHDRFKQLPREALSNYDEILAAHRVRDRVKQELDFALTQEETIQVLKVYEKAFRELGLID